MARNVTITIGDALERELQRHNTLLFQKAARLSPAELAEMDQLRDRIAWKLYCSVMGEIADGAPTPPPTFHTPNQPGESTE